MHSICSFSVYGSFVWQHFVWIHDAVRVENLLDTTHVVYHSDTLGVVEEASLLVSDTMLGTDASARILHEVHHERFDHVVQLLLQGLVFVAWDSDVQVKVAVSDVAEACRSDLLFLSCGELRGCIDQVLGFIHDLVEIVTA